MDVKACSFIVHVVVNCLFQVIFLFLLFQRYKYTLPYPKTKENQNYLSLIKKINYNIYAKYLF